MLSWFRAIMPKEDGFFDMFERHSQVLVAGAEALHRLLSGGPDIAAGCAEVKRHEKAADDITAEVLLAVRRSDPLPPLPEGASLGVRFWFTYLGN